MHKAMESVFSSTDTCTHTQKHTHTSIHTHTESVCKETERIPIEAEEEESKFQHESQYVVVVKKTAKVPHAEGKGTSVVSRKWQQLRGPC